MPASGHSYLFRHTHYAELKRLCVDPESAVLIKKLQKSNRRAQGLTRVPYGR